MLAAKGEVRLFCDADNSTDIAHFDKMKPLFDQGYDVVIASRNAKDVPEALQVVSQAWYKRAIGRLGNRIVQIAVVPGIWDTQCGFKAFRAEAAERIFAQTTIDGLGIRYRSAGAGATAGLQNRHRFGALAQRRPQPCKIVRLFPCPGRYLHRAA